MSLTEPIDFFLIDHNSNNLTAIMVSVYLNVTINVRFDFNYQTDKKIIVNPQLKTRGYLIYQYFLYIQNQNMIVEIHFIYCVVDVIWHVRILHLHL